MGGGESVLVSSLGRRRTDVTGYSATSRCLCLRYWGGTRLEARIGGGFKVWFRLIAKVQAAAEFPVTPAITKILARLTFWIMLHLYGVHIIIIVGCILGYFNHHRHIKIL